MADEAWYYANAGAQVGPVSPDGIRALVASGVVARETLVWHSGMPEWQPVGSTALAAGLPPPIGAFASGSGPPHGGYPPYPPAPSWRARSPDFGDAIRICLSKYVVWAGRATRSEFWWFYLFGLLASMGASILDIVLIGRSHPSTPISTLVGLALFLPQLAVYVRRLHDTNRSAWWLMQPLGCIVGVIGLAVILIATDAASPAYTLIALPALAIFWPIVFMCQAGTPGPNRYG